MQNDTMSGQRIIIAEDNLVMQDVMRYVLTAAGFQVTTAEEGTVALDLLEQHSADLLVTDCQMPGLSGIELCRAIRRHPRFSDLPIVFCSAKGFEIPRETLQELGISVALDDFGTGFSSLSSLRQLPFDRIKIDRSFVTGIVHNSSNQKILAGIMTLANGLDIPVTAEGVETAEDRDFLASIACTTGQGFWFDRPRPADQVNWMLETHQAPGEKAAALARPAAQLRPVSEA